LANYHSLRLFHNYFLMVIMLKVFFQFLFLFVLLTIVAAYLSIPVSAEKILLPNPLPNISTPEDLAKKVVNWLLGLVSVIALIVLIIGGFRYLTSGGNEKAMESAKNIITWAVVGLIIILCSAIIINVIISILGGSSTNP